jgi:hypothetical protein
MPDHAKRHPQHQHQQHYGDYRIPDSFLVKHFEEQLRDTAPRIN